MDVPRALSGSPRAPRITAQRVARFRPSYTRNCLPPKKLRRDIQCIRADVRRVQVSMPLAFWPYRQSVASLQAIDRHSIRQQKVRPAQRCSAAVALFALTGLPMADNIGALTVGAVQQLDDHCASPSCWCFGSSHLGIGRSISTPLRHLPPPHVCVCGSLILRGRGHSSPHGTCYAIRLHVPCLLVRSA